MWVGYTPTVPLTQLAKVGEARVSVAMNYIIITTWWVRYTPTVPLTQLGKVGGTGAIFCCYELHHYFNIVGGAHTHSLYHSNS